MAPQEEIARKSGAAPAAVCQRYRRGWLRFLKLEAGRDAAKGAALTRKTSAAKQVGPPIALGPLDRMMIRSGELV